MRVPSPSCSKGRGRHETLAARARTAVAHWGRARCMDRIRRRPRTTKGIGNLDCAQTLVLLCRKLRCPDPGQRRVTTRGQSAGSKEDVPPRSEQKTSQNRGQGFTRWRTAGSFQKVPRLVRSARPSTFSGPLTPLPRLATRCSRQRCLRQSRIGGPEPAWPEVGWPARDRRAASCARAQSIGHAAAVEAKA